MPHRRRRPVGGASTWRAGWHIADSWAKDLLASGLPNFVQPVQNPARPAAQQSAPRAPLRLWPLLIKKPLLGKQAQERVQTGAVELGGLELHSGAEQNCAAEESNSLPLAFSCCARILDSSILLSTPGSRRQLSNCCAEAFGYDSHNRQRGSDEPDAPLPVEGDAVAEEIDMVVRALESNQADHQPADGLNPAVFLQVWRNRSELPGCGPPATSGIPGIKLGHRSLWIQQVS